MYRDILRQSSVLLVEDDEQLRKKFAIALELHVSHIYEAANGLDALESFKRHHPNIIISDIRMPIMDGLEFIKTLRTQDMDTPIIIVSAYSDKELLIDFMSLRLIEYLVKPIDYEQLESVLMRCAKMIDDYSLMHITLSERSKYFYSKKSLVIDEKSVHLSPKEAAFLELLIQNRNQLVTTQMIEEYVYDNQSITASTIHNLSYKLRKKIGASIIVPVSGMGVILKIS